MSSKTVEAVENVEVSEEAVTVNKTKLIVAAVASTVAVVGIVAFKLLSKRAKDEQTREDLTIVESSTVSNNDEAAAS